MYIYKWGFVAILRMRVIWFVLVGVCMGLNVVENYFWVDVCSPHVTDNLPGSINHLIYISHV
jgi:hypothetical protein